MSNHKKQNFKYDFSEDELKGAAIKVCEVLGNTVPEISENEYKFSDSFNIRMAKLIKKSRFHYALSNLLKYSVAAILALIIIAGVCFGISPAARANFSQWIRTGLTDNKVLYVIMPQIENAKIIPCEINWLPDGLEEIQKVETPDSFTIIFGDVNNEFLIFDCQTIDSIANMEITGLKLESKDMFIQDFPAELYTDEENNSKLLLWTDNEHGLIFSLNGNFSKKDLLKIADNITYG